LAEALLSELTTRIEGLTLIPSDGGRHEITVDGELIYSKLETGRHPEIEEIKKAVRARL
jgi:selenoprotein W-related protein